MIFRKVVSFSSVSLLGYCVICVAVVFVVGVLDLVFLVGLVLIRLGNCSVWGGCLCFGGFVLVKCGI